MLLRSQLTLAFAGLEGPSRGHFCVHPVCAYELPCGRPSHRSIVLLARIATPGFFRVCRNPPLALTNGLATELKS